MLIMKFGGTSVTNLASVNAIVQLVKRELTRKPVVVVSALSKVTDLLIQLSEKCNNAECQLLFSQLKDKHYAWIDNVYSQDLAYRKVATEQIDSYLLQLQDVLNLQNFCSKLAKQDSIVAFGEKMSSYLIAQYLISNGINAKAVLATECIVTSSDFGGAEVLEENTKIMSRGTLLPLVESGCIPVITGFIGATTRGETTVLGRGGSDYSAAILGHALSAVEVQIWTDVDGVFSADPRVIQDAKLIKQLSYREAAELAMFGAKVLHPRTIQPAVKSSIPVRVLNTFNVDNEGTLISHDADHQNGKVKAITWRKLVPLINICSADMFLNKGFLQKIFAILTSHNISANMLSASEVSVSITLDDTGNLAGALSQLNEFAEAEYLDGYGTISLVGEKIMETPSLMQEVFNLFEKTQTRVEMLSYGASNINLNMMVAKDKIHEVVPLLHQKFIS